MSPRVWSTNGEKENRGVTTFHSPKQDDPHAAIEEELQFHLDCRASELAAEGVPPDEALPEGGQVATPATPVQGQ